MCNASIKKVQDGIKLLDNWKEQTEQLRSDLEATGGVNILEHEVDDSWKGELDSFLLVHSSLAEVQFYWQSFTDKKSASTNRKWPLSERRTRAKKKKPTKKKHLKTS